eukprot:m51a1_g4389 hypothetical protein (888) ;mRNA; r:352451-356152
MLEVDSGASDYAGLTTAESADLLRAHGPNELPHDRPPSMLDIALGVLKEPMFLLLAVCASLYFLLGEYDEAAMLSSFVLFIVCITVFQERRTERALLSLRSLSPSVATVCRDGVFSRVPAKDIVPGDLVELREGDCVPADLTLLACMGLQVDEALLTGESAPVAKCSGPSGTNSALQPAGHGASWSCFSGTMVVGGRATGVVRATGEDTQIGSIGRSLHALPDERTPLEREVRTLVFNMAVVGAVACAVVFLAYGATKHDWLHATLSGLSLAMGLLPEEFPVVLAVFVTIGALRMSWKRVLVRRNKAVEALSSCTVLCTDKTGTLTANGMAVDTLVSAAGDSVSLAAAPELAVPEALHEIVEVALMAGSHPCDPTDAALRALVSCGSVDAAHERRAGDGWSLLREFPFCRAARCAACVWSPPSRPGVYDVACKGAPEALLPMCRSLSPAAAEKALGTAAALAAKGLRVLAVARAPAAARVPESPADAELQLVGIVAFSNPLRPSAAGVVHALQSAGVRVVMMTGDAAQTARHIACEAGISGVAAMAGGAELVTGEELDRADNAALRSLARETPVFARVLPHQKLRVVQAMKDNGEVVCMIGDGVNDAPALKSAHVGVAMGRRGTAVAREAAAMVLLDDELGAVVDAVRMGRRIRDNLVKTMAYIIAVHVPLCGMVVVPVLLGWPTVFYPAHIVWMELIIDPTCSVVFEAEPEEPGVMDRPPAPTTSRIVSARSFGLALAQGTAVLVSALALWRWCVGAGFSEGQANAMAFGALTVSNVALVVTNRSWTQSCLSSMRHRNVPLLVMIAVVVPLMLTALFFAPLRSVMHFEPIGVAQIPAFAFVGLASVSWFEAYKLGAFVCGGRRGTAQARASQSLIALEEGRAPKLT